MTRFIFKEGCNSERQHSKVDSRAMKATTGDEMKFPKSSRQKEGGDRAIIIVTEEEETVTFNSNNCTTYR